MLHYPALRARQSHTMEVTKLKRSRDSNYLVRW
jgi:hypothetical protein